MKIKTTFWLLLLTVFSFTQAQNITVTLPPNPPANTANWVGGSSIFSITLTSSQTFAEGRILVFIKSSDGKLVCGTNDPAMAQPGQIRPGVPKVWTGHAALALLGDQCELPVGSYELCVQLFSAKNKRGMEPDLERCFPFDIRPLDCAPPNNITPQANALLKETDILKPVSFNWTPFIMSGQKRINYRFTLWELEEDQTVYEAMYNNFPLLNEEVRGRNSYVARPGEFEKREARYFWRVTAIDEYGEPLCDDAQSEPTQFSVGLTSRALVSAEEPDSSNTEATDSCCVNQILDKGETVSISPAGIAEISHKFNISPENIRHLSAEIIAVSENPTQADCIDCAEHENRIYHFVSHNTAAWNGSTAWNASPVNSIGYYPAKKIEWHFNTQGDLEINLRIALPRTKGNCKLNSTICIRYRFMNENCNTCEEIVCYDIKN